MLATVLVPITFLGRRKSTWGRRAVLLKSALMEMPMPTAMAAAEVFGVAGDAIEIDGGTHIDDHAGAAVFIEAGDAVDQAIGADLVGVVVTDVEADIGVRVPRTWRRCGSSAGS